MKENKYSTIVISGDLNFTNVGQLVKSDIFEKLVIDFIEELESRKSSKVLVLAPFRDENGKVDIHKLTDFIILLNIKPLHEVIGAGYFKIDCSIAKFAGQVENFLEGIYNFWRNMQRFMVEEKAYSTDDAVKRSKGHSLAINNENLRKLVLELYRNILYNVTNKGTSVYRQLPAGAQVSFLVDTFRFPSNVKSKNESLYQVPYVWEAIFEPPVIFYTKSSKRQGVFPIKRDKSILERFYLDKKSWYAIPIKVGRLLMVVYCHRDFLELGTGLFNLFELAKPEEFIGRKPDGVVLFGLDKSLFEEDEARGLIVNEDGVYYGALPNSAEVDYFGYMKKMVLTVHNIIQIEQNNLPIHGAFARISIAGEEPVNIMLVGDSGAGKSETLEAIQKLPANIHCDVDVLIDDMGSLHFNKQDELMALGTEIGAFVRLDDLQPGYAYNTMDRSIFMNPNLVNARVIVPQMAYEDISKSTPVHYIFYINNYEEIGENIPAIDIIEDLDTALGMFSEGKRMAKGTTGEVGLTTTYFANPFGAVQMQQEHEKIAKNYFKKMKGTGVSTGVIRTQLGIPGFEQSGPLTAAAALVEFIKNIK